MKRVITKRSIWIILSILAISVILTALLLELFDPEASKRRPPLLIKPDHHAGWVNTPGIYNYPAVLPGYDNVHVSILDDGRRATSDVAMHFNEADTDILMIGCSYTFGTALSDQETFSWKLQQQHPTLKISNYGTLGYGTYNVLLKLQSILPKLKKPKFVIYGLIADHEVRNLALQSWLPKNLPAPLPYVNIDHNNQLIRLETRNFESTNFAFLKKLRIYKIVERQLLELKQNLPSIRQKRTLVLQRLLKEINELVHKHGAQFYTVILEAPKGIASDYMLSLNSQGVKTIDCNISKKAGYRVPGDGHPNGKLTSLWADCINNEIGLN